MSKSLFITVEGGEGVGKTTFIESLSNKLKALGISLHTTREPGGTKVADRIREIFAYPPEEEPLTLLAELFLICAARSQHVSTVLRPTLDQGSWILCDRYSDSTRVYQGLLGGLESEVEKTLVFAEQGLQPDITFLLDCPVDIVLNRLQQRMDDGSTQPTRYDNAKESLHQKMRQSFLEVQSKFPDRIKTIDSSLKTEDAVDQAMRYLKKWL